MMDNQFVLLLTDNATPFEHPFAQHRSSVQEIWTKDPIGTANEKYCVGHSSPLAKTNYQNFKHPVRGGDISMHKDTRYQKFPTPKSKPNRFAVQIWIQSICVTN